MVGSLVVGLVVGRVVGLVVGRVVGLVVGRLVVLVVLVAGRGGGWVAGVVGGFVGPENTTTKAYIKLVIKFLMKDASSELCARFDSLAHLSLADLKPVSF